MKYFCSSHRYQTRKYKSFNNYVYLSSIYVVVISESLSFTGCEVCQNGGTDQCGASQRDAPHQREDSHRKVAPAVVNASALEFLKRDDNQKQMLQRSVTCGSP